MINSDQLNITPVGDTGTNSSINIREVLTKYLYHWPVFVLGVVLCLFIAFIYLRYTQPIYQITGTLLIKDDKKGPMSKAGDLLDEIDLFGGSKIVENEMDILKSKTLMRKVVDLLFQDIQNFQLHTEQYASPWDKNP
jgi:tyrosine-protein kinase Etk/Wzc